jgi:hypothetical protein
MITIDDMPKYAIVTFLQDAIAGAFAGKVALANFHAADGTSLVGELRAGQLVPRNLALDFSPLLDLLHLPQLGAGRPETILEVLSDPLGELNRIFAGGDPTAILARVMDFFTCKPELASLLPTLGSFLEGQFGIALSLVTTFKNLVDPKFPHAVADALLQYFFGKDGYVTVDEIHVTPPMQLVGLPQHLSDLNSFLSQKTGERYLRDIMAIIVEATGDVQYNLRDRYPRMLSQLTAAAQQETAKRWFTGFASMAEAGTTTAVEETLLGLGTFQGNRLIAASAAAYAGTAARKATQHVFLSEMERDRG